MMRDGRRLSRRAFARAGAAALGMGTHRRLSAARHAAPTFSYPIGLPGRPLGDGFLIRHGYACENTWYNPGYWHTGEDWYRLDRDTAGAGVYAVATGEAVFAGSDYPGLVIILRHEEALYSMYGHLDSTLAIAEGQRVVRGQLLGHVLERTDGRAPSHLHFEIRTFFTTPEVNGNAPRFGFACGYECPPGPGYWPIAAPEHPSAMGWRNPSHVISRRAWAEGVPVGVEVVVTAAAPASTVRWSAPPDIPRAMSLGNLALVPGARYRLLEVAGGAEGATGTSAESYQLWYRIALPAGETIWVQAAIPSTAETGSDGRPSAPRLDLLPVVFTPET